MEDGAEIVGFRVPVEARSWYLAASDGEFAGNSPEKDREVRELW
jgi:hypothetical protein